MIQSDILSSISQTYITDATSHYSRILMNSRRYYRGKFVKCRQLEVNAIRNKWIITIEFVEIMVDGNDIKSFFPFKHQ
jgi:hypothetical protein